jgi:triacylglycerol lipase
LFADYLLSKIPTATQNRVANTYNSTLRKFGEPNPDFLAAVNDLTDSACKQLNTEISTPQGIYCQSVGSVLTKATSGKFPLNLSYHLVKHFSGENDGLVDESSFEWGENYVLIRPTEKRGISHGDMIDLNRQNFKGFDVREFYVNLVSDLKNKGF